VNVAQHGVVVLAAGASRRMGTAKQLLAIEGETLVHRAARLALATEPAEAVIVLGHDAGNIAVAIADLPLRHVVCTESGRGMGASLAAGLAALGPQSAGALVLLCDQPALSSAHLRALVEHWRRCPERAAASAYAGVVGVPAVLPRTWFALVHDDGDRGARALLRERSDVDSIACDDLAVDIDTPEQRAAFTDPAASR
jgi:CTP:molybdopterin cytidylyltransferase MocA